MPLSGDELLVHRGLDVNYDTDEAPPPLTPMERLLPLASEAIQTQLWTKNVLGHVLQACSQDCKHILSPLLQLHNLSSSHSTHQTAPQNDNDFNPDLLHAITLKYGQLMNKVRKMQQLEQSRLALLHDNFVLTKQLASFPIQANKLFTNIMNGVQLLPPKKKTQKGSGSIRLKSSTPVSSTLPHEALQQEIQTLKFNTSTIESYKHNEELFWKWFATSKYDVVKLQDSKVAMNLGPYAEAMDLLLPLTMKLQDVLQNMEEQVTLVLVSQKISNNQIQDICSVENDNMVRQLADMIRIAIPVVSKEQNVTVALLQELMQITLHSKLQAEFDHYHVTRQEIRTANQTALQQLAEEFIRGKAPFDMLLKL